VLSHRQGEADPRPVRRRRGAGRDPGREAVRARRPSGGVRCARRPVPAALPARLTVRRGAAAAGTVIFFLAAPCVVAGVVPWWLTRWQVRSAWLPVRVLGVLLIVAGAAVLVHAFARFALEGVGTPAPVAPTRELVVGGLYGYVRNPMYLAVVSIIAGQALALGQPGLLVYAAAVAAAMWAFVRWYEEPTLRRQFGAEYDAYRAAVPGWWPRSNPWEAERLETGRTHGTKRS